MLKYTLLWLPMTIIAIINGTARDLWYNKYVSELAARQISTVSLIVLLGFYIYLTIKKYPPQSTSQALLIGLLWVVLTLGFEFGIGIISGNSWTKLLEDYNLMKGHLWILVPIWTFLAPYFFYKCKL